jgi:hypothetical protein
LDLITSTSVKVNINVSTKLILLDYKLTVVDISITKSSGSEYDYIWPLLFWNYYFHWIYCNCFVIETYSYLFRNSIIQFNIFRSERNMTYYLVHDIYELSNIHILANNNELIFPSNQKISDDIEKCC